MGQLVVIMLVMYMIKNISHQQLILVKVDIENQLLLKHMKNKNIKYYIAASRGRDPENLGRDGFAHHALGRRADGPRNLWRLHS